MDPAALYVFAFVFVVLGLPLFGLGWWLARWLRRRPALNERLEAMVASPPKKGYLKLAQVRGIPVLFHWSFPIGILGLGAVVGFEPRATIAFGIGYAFLVVFHEFGHVAAARLLGLKVFAVEMSGLGGLCRIQLPRGVGDTLFLYSAGLLAQLAVLMLTLMYLAAFGSPAGVVGNSFVLIFTVVNLLMIGLNLVPYAPRFGIASDGYVLWQLLLHVWRNAPHPLAFATAPSHVFPPETRLLSMREFVPDKFAVGVEVLNDNSTPMEFVVEVLTKHLRLDPGKAIEAMLTIHQKGGMLLPLSSLADAETVATNITQAAADKGHQLVCRAVDASSNASVASP